MSTRVPVQQHTPWRRVVPIGAMIAVLACLIVLAFLWPAIASAHRDVPIAVSGSTEQIEQIQMSLDENADGAFELRTVEGRDEAVQLIKERDVYGAIVLAGGATPEVLETTAGSSAVAQSLTSLATTLEQQTQSAAIAEANSVGAPVPEITVTVTDIVPLNENDPRGAGLAAAMFPLVMGGMIGGIVLSIAVHGASRRLIGVIAYSVVGGLAVPAILQGWFGILQGPYLENVAAFALSLGAISATIVGAASLIGRAGIAVGPVVFMLFASPISSSSTPVEFLPEPSNRERERREPAERRSRPPTSVVARSRTGAQGVPVNAARRSSFSTAVATASGETPSVTGRAAAAMVRPPGGRRR
jgi:hypothetical protein